MPENENPFVDEVVTTVPLRGSPPWKVAIVDDEQEVHDVTVLALDGVELEGRGLTFLGAHSAHAARELFAAHPDIAIVLLDVVMETDDAGLALVSFLRDSLKNQSVRIVLRTGQPGQAPEAKVIRQYDISDYRAKTEMTSTRLFTTVISALRTYQQLAAVEAQRAQLQSQLVEIERLSAALERERDYLREEVRHAEGSVIGSSPAFARALAHVDAVARTDATVLVLGESGVGKELIARRVHEASRRAAGPLVKVNCASIPRELFESEFFGHVKGAFTGAHRDREGRFQLAHGGTLFLDEVGEIPLELQGKLLRALQEREVERIGDARIQKVDVRLVAATNRDLKAAVERGSFRADLYFRLSVFPVLVPPLRERPSDIAPLFEHFLARACVRLGRRHLSLTPDDARRLANYAWPGNVRELENVVERAAILSNDGVLRLDVALPELAGIDWISGRPELREPTGSSRPTEPAGPTEPIETDPVSVRSASLTLVPPRGFYTAAEMRELERRNLVAAVEAAGGRIAGEGGAAERLGMKPSTLAYQLKSFAKR